MIERNGTTWYLVERKQMPDTLNAVKAPSAPCFVRFMKSGEVRLHPTGLLDNYIDLHDDKSLCHADYPWQHSGDGQNIIESNGRISVVWMGRESAGWGTPIWTGEYHLEDGKPVITRFPLHMSGFKPSPGQSNPNDNHNNPQLLQRASDLRLIFVSGAHSGVLYAAVSHSPHSVIGGFNRFFPISPVTKYPVHGYTYPLCWMTGDTLNIVARLYDGVWSLQYWTVNTLTMNIGTVTEIDAPPNGTKYCIWYQQREANGQISYQRHTGENGNRIKPATPERVLWHPIIQN